MRLTNTLRSAFVRAALDDVPKIDYETQLHDAALAMAVALLPEKAQALFVTHPELVAKNGTRVGSSFLWLPGHAIKFSDAQLAQLTILREKIVAHDEARDELRAKLKHIAYSTNSTKTLRELLPEFSKYLPENLTKSTNLPAIANVVADFVKAGWPSKKEPSHEVL